MVDLPDYYTLAQISEAEAASFKGGLDANKSATPVSRQVYFATDTGILYVCVVDGAWTGFDAAIITQGALAYARLDLTGNVVVADLAAAILNAANGLVQLDGAALLPQAQLPVHGAAKHTDIARTLFLPANAHYIGAGSSSFFGYFASAEGTANANQPVVRFAMKVPADFASFTKIEAVWGATAAAGNMYWNLQAYYCAPGEVNTTHFDSTGDDVTATGGTSFLNVQEHPNPLTLASLALGDYIGIVFTRQGANVLDTMDVATSLVGLLFTYTANQ